MKAAFTDGNRQIETRNVSDPIPGEGEVLLKLEASGLCGSDLHAYRTPAEDGTGMPIGHETCGVVEELGPNVDAQKTPVGVRAIQHHYLGYESCDQFSGGWTQLCQNGYIGYGYDVPGSHAQYMAFPALTLVPLPSFSTFTAGANMASGTGTVFQALHRLDIREGEALIIYGLDPVGLSVTQFGYSMGTRVIGVDITENRRRMQRA